VGNTAHTFFLKHKNMAKKRRGKRMQVLEYIYNLRKDKLATKRYLADAEVQISKNENSSNYQPIPQDKPLFEAISQNKSILGQITQPTEYYQNSQPNFLPQIDYSLPEKPILQQNSNNNFLYIGIGLLLVFILKPFKRNKNAR